MGQLRKFLIVFIVIIFQCSSFANFLQFADFGVEQVYAQGSGEKVDLVAVLVSNQVFSAIQSDLSWYTTQYIPKQAPGTKSLVIPIDPSGFEASDIQQLLENLYFDGQQGVASQLVGVILLGDMPWPIVEMDSRRFVSIYPYVDFDDPMFLYDPVEDVFMYNDAPNSLPELRHSTIPTDDVSVFSTFFSKLKEYDANPSGYAERKIWYDDFPYLKQSFAKEELERYLNTLIFAESDSFRQNTPMFSRLLSRNGEEKLVEHVDKAKAAIDYYQGQAPGHDSVSGHPETEAAASEILAGVNSIFERLQTDQLKQSIVETGELPVPTKVIERQMEQHFQPGYQIFGNTYLSELQDNILAGGRYAPADIDTSLEKMEIWDRVSKQFLKDMNQTMEEALTEKVLEEDYQLKYPLPFRFSKWKPWYEPDACGGVFFHVPYTMDFFEKVFNGYRWLAIQKLFFNKLFLQGDFMGLLIGPYGQLYIDGVFLPEGMESFERARYENFYFGKNAVDVTEYEDLSIYRGTYANILNQEEARGLSYTENKDLLDDNPQFDMSKSSVGSSLGIFSQQVEWNKAYNLDRGINDRTVDMAHDYKWSDKELYDRLKCGDQEPDEFSYDMWAGASPMNIDSDEFSQDPKYPITKPEFTDRELAWNPSEERIVGGPWLDPSGGRLVLDEIEKEKIHDNAHSEWGSVIELWNEPKWTRLLRAVNNEKKIGEYKSVLDGRIEWCEERKQLDDFPGRTSFEEIEYFWVYDNVKPGFVDAEWVGITVQPTLGHDEDQDSDGKADRGDDDRDGDGIINKDDDDQDGDRIHFKEDLDLDGDGTRNGSDDDIDEDTVKNEADGDMDGDRVPDSSDEDVDQDFMNNDVDNDIDADGIRNGADSDIDGDGIPNIDDPDMDGDGIPNGEDPDKDADLVPDKNDGGSCGGGGCNGGSSNVDADDKPNGEDDDVDGDGILNGDDRDVDGDGLMNYEDGDINGDSEMNDRDSDMDGDGLLNTEDDDIDGDGIENAEDDTPTGIEYIGVSSVSLILTDEPCSGEIRDIDGDGVYNGVDLDIDNDGYHNAADADMDGDGIRNNKDTDIDCDGKINSQDSDMDGDGITNDADNDINGDGVPNGQDADIDGDGIPNGSDDDIDGDGVLNGNDGDIDGDGIVNGNDDDVDSDGIPNGSDDDIDGDGIRNIDDPDMDGDGLLNDRDPDMDGDGILNNDEISGADDTVENPLVNPINNASNSAKTTSLVGTTNNKYGVCVLKAEDVPTVPVPAPPAPAPAPAPTPAPAPPAPDPAPNPNPYPQPNPTPNPTPAPDPAPINGTCTGGSNNGNSCSSDNDCKPKVCHRTDPSRAGNSCETSADCSTTGFAERCCVEYWDEGAQRYRNVCTDVYSCQGCGRMSAICENELPLTEHCLTYPEPDVCGNCVDTVCVLSNYACVPDTSSSSGRCDTSAAVAGTNSVNSFNTNTGLNTSNCEDNSDCIAGYICDLTIDPNPGVCFDRGGECDSDSDCGNGFECTRNDIAIPVSQEIESGVMELLDNNNNVVVIHVHPTYDFGDDIIGLENGINNSVGSNGNGRTIASNYNYEVYDGLSLISVEDLVFNCQGKDLTKCPKVEKGSGKYDGKIDAVIEAVDEFFAIYDTYWPGVDFFPNGSTPLSVTVYSDPSGFEGFASRNGVYINMKDSTDRGRAKGVTYHELGHVIHARLGVSNIGAEGEQVANLWLALMRGGHGKSQIVKRENVDPSEMIWVQFYMNQMLFRGFKEIGEVKIMNAFKKAVIAGGNGKAYDVNDADLLYTTMRRIMIEDGYDQSDIDAFDLMASERGYILLGDDGNRKQPEGGICIASQGSNTACFVDNDCGESEVCKISEPGNDPAPVPPENGNTPPEDGNIPPENGNTPNPGVCLSGGKCDTDSDCGNGFECQNKSVIQIQQKLTSENHASENYDHAGFDRFFEYVQQKYGDSTEGIDDSALVDYNSSRIQENIILSPDLLSESVIQNTSFNTSRGKKVKIVGTTKDGLTVPVPFVNVYLSSSISDRTESLKTNALGEIMLTPSQFKKAMRGVSVVLSVVGRPFNWDLVTINVENLKLKSSGSIVNITDNVDSKIFDGYIKNYRIEPFKKMVSDSFVFGLALEPACPNSSASSCSVDLSNISLNKEVETISELFSSTYGLYKEQFAEHFPLRYTFEEHPLQILIDHKRGGRYGANTLKIGLWESDRSGFLVNHELGHAIDSRGIGGPPTPAYFESFANFWATQLKGKPTVVSITSLPAIYGYVYADGNILFTPLQQLGDSEFEGEKFGQGKVMGLLYDALYNNQGTWEPGNTLYDDISMLRVLYQDIQKQLDESYGSYWATRYMELNKNGLGKNSCFNGNMDGDETDVDCGGGCMRCSFVHPEKSYDNLNIESLGQNPDDSEFDSWFYSQESQGEAIDTLRDTGYDRKCNAGFYHNFALDLYPTSSNSSIRGDNPSGDVYESNYNGGNKNYEVCVLNEQNTIERLPCDECRIYQGPTYFKAGSEQRNQSSPPQKELPKKEPPKNNPDPVGGSNNICVPKDGTSIECFLDKDCGESGVCGSIGAPKPQPSPEPNKPNPTFPENPNNPPDGGNKPSTLCSGQDQDIDRDGIVNGEDRDVDDDGILNDSDPDIDGDGALNGQDRDVDCDGIPNGEDRDCDGDGIANRYDDDVDGDGLKNGEDDDIDGDGLKNGVDYDDVDGDGLNNEEDDDIDGDGIPDQEDDDMDGDGIENGADRDCNCNGKPRGKDYDDNKDGIPDDEEGEFELGDKLSNREDRGDYTCFLTGFDYRYQIIDSVVVHRNVNELEHDEETSMLTLERPIDDGRYITFHGIGGDQVDMIFPDLYNVPIYEGCLQEPKLIEEAIREYLKQKVEVYNELLEEQLSKAPGHYATHPAAFDFLATVDQAASPNRSYELMEETFFEDLLGDKNIERIAIQLNYMSKGRGKKPQGGTIGEFIENARKEFNINKKLEFVLDEYLSYDDPGNEIKFDQIAYPTHIEKKKAYEVGYINSDGFDYVKHQDPLNDQAEAAVAYGLNNANTTKTDVGDTTHKGAITAFTDGQQKDEICGFPPDRAVPVLKRPAAFSCWLTRTLQDPVDFTFEIEYNFGGTAGDEYLNRLGDWGMKSKQGFENAADQFGSLGNENVQIVNLGVGQVFAADSSAGSVTRSNKQVQVGLDDTQMERFNQLLYDMVADFDGSNYITSDQDSLNISFGARKNIGNVRLTVSSQGVCPTIAGTNLCANEYTAVSNFYTSPTGLPLRFAATDVGVGTILISACDVTDTDLCASHSLLFTRGPGTLKQVSLKLPGDKLATGATIPIHLAGYDDNGNELSYTDIGYDIIIEGGSFVEGKQVNTVSVTNFDDAYYLVYTDSSVDQVTFTMQTTQEAYRDEFPIVSRSIDLVGAAFAISSDEGENLDRLTFKLPQREDGFTVVDENGVVQLRKSSLKMLSLDVVSGGDSLIAPISITSRNDLVRIGKVGKRQVQTGNSSVEQEYFIAQDYDVTKGNGPVEFVLMPTGIAGNDELLISSPGIESFIVPLSVQTSGADNLQIDLDATGKNVGDVIEGVITITDSRGNLYDITTDVELEPFGGLELAKDIVTVGSGVAVFTGTIKAGGGGGCNGKCGGGKSNKEPNPKPGDDQDDGNDDDNDEGDDGDDGDDGDSDDGTENPGDDANPAPVDPDKFDNWQEPAGGSKSGLFGQGSGSGGSPDDGTCDDYVGNELTDPSLRYESGNIFGQATITVPKVVWPDKPVEDDINVMYLNLYGAPWGNERDTTNILKNTKTLAITTFQNLGGSATDRKIVAAMIHPNGTVKDKKNIVKDLVARGGDIVIELGYNGSIGEVSMGSYTEYDFLQEGGEYTEKPNKLVYTAGDPDSVTDSSSFDGGRIYHNNQIVVDFSRGIMDPAIAIRLPEGGGNERRVTYQNKQIGKLWIHRTTPGISRDTQIFRSDYTSEVRPSGNSTTSREGISILLDAEESSNGDSALFESIESSFDPTKNIGFRHEFSPITNFAQGMPMGESTRHFGGISLMNIGDPFLMRINENRSIKHTTYDGGPGQKIFSDATAIEDVDLIDYDNDGKKDFLITYKTGGLRILKNYGGENPFQDLGLLMLVADGTKETFVGDVNNDGWDDILVHTKSDKMRAYLNENGQMQVDGRIVCLDIPNGEFNVAQAKQIMATDLDGGGLDIITYDSDGDLKVFYGGGNSYLSTDPFKCDDGWKGRQKQQLLKSFPTTLSGPISDYSLRHWSGLSPIDFPSNDQSFQESGGGGGGSAPPFKSMSDEQLKAYSKQQMVEAKEKVLSIANPKDLFETGKKGIDYVFEIPDLLRPQRDQGKSNYGGIRANDDFGGARFDVTKSFEDLDGGNLRKGDIVKVTVALIPVGSVQGAVYRDKLEGPWIIYKDEFGAISSFEDAGLGGATIDRNVGNGYEFMIYDLDLSTTRTFTYEVQYNGDGYMHIDLETLKKNMFKGSSAASLGSTLGVESVYAQDDQWSSRIRAYPDDGCYKDYWEFTPEESKKSLQGFLNSEQSKYEKLYDDNQKTATDLIEDNTELTPIERFLGVPRMLQNEVFANRQKSQINSVVRGGTASEIDVTSYNDYFVAKAEDTIQRIWKAPIKGINALGFDEMGLFEDYEFSNNICGGATFGKKTCGNGLPIPFNNDILSPGTFNIMGCKPQGPNIPDFFPDFAGVPIFAFPTNVLFLPVWPPMPPGAGGIPPFKGKTSQIRSYVTWTTSNGLGFSICFGPYGATNGLPDPLSDVTGNCLVVASNLGGQCSGTGEDNNPAITKRLIKGNQYESSNVLTKNHHDLYNLGTCDDVAKESSPIVGSALGGKISVGGETIGIQGTSYKAKQDYLKGGTPFELKIEGGDVKGLTQCIIRKWTEKQSRYFANNALNMQIDLILPTLDKIAENFEDIKDISSDNISFQYDWENRKDSFKKTSNPGTRSQGFDSKKKNAKVFMPKGVLPETSELFNNPFDMVASYFDNVPLINFEERDVAIEIPWMYQEDINRYEYYLTTWIERNEEILQAWKDSDKVEPDFIDTMESSLRTAKRNLMTLKQYRELPTKIYEMLHSTDQYVTEVVGFSEEFLTQITGWLQDNARRFSTRVDFVIVLKGIIETWQLLLDFSVNRQSKCAKCRQDHYDFYSCKLKLLCIDLPVLPIPPFHIPNIEIDLSKITLGIDIILPKFNFVPRKQVLPQLPDFPSPLAAELNVSVPVVPMLPPPPPLPDLPTLDLNIDIRLPTLPPAPKIPKLSPVVKSVIEIADVLGTFMCIFKGGIGLVSEKGIKTRVEQLTQRRNDIMPFDEIEVTIPQSPVAGYDYKIDSVVDIKADFRELYDIVDQIASEWNVAVDKAVEGTVGEAGKSISSASNNFDNIGIEIEIDNNLPSEILGSADTPDIEQLTQQVQDGILSQDELISIVKTRRSSMYLGGSVESIRNSLNDGLAYILRRQDLSIYHPAARSINKMLSRVIAVNPNIDGLNAVRSDVREYLDDQAKEIGDLKDLVRDDYDSFVDTLTLYNLISDNGENRSFGSSLYETDSATLDTLTRGDAPMNTYLAMNKTFVDGYSDALKKQRPIDLQMSQIEYDQFGNYFDSLSAKIQQAQGISATVISKSDQPVLASAVGIGGINDITQIAQGTSQPTSTTNPPLKVDFSQYIEGFYVPGSDKNFHNVIEWTEKADEWYENNTYHIEDINQDGGLDIINFDDHQIYIKYNKQNDSFGGGGYSKRYQIGPFASARDLEKSVEDSSGWYEIGNENFKIWDDQNTVYSYFRFGHSFEAMSFAWDNDPHVAGYIIEISERLQTNHEKNRGGPKEDDPRRTRYVLALPSSISYQNLALEIQDQLDKKKVDTLLQDGTIIDVTSYDPNQLNIQSMLQDLDRRWYYTRIAPLRMVDNKGGGFFSGIFGGNQPDYLLKRVGPWSSQRLAGAQNWADSQTPSIGLELVRDLTGETVAKGTIIQGMINTTYTLNATWDDNGEIIKNWIVYSGDVVKLEEGNTIALDNLDYKYPIEEEFQFYAIDQAGNIGQENVKLSIIVPELDIEEIRYEGAGAKVVTRLSQTIDRGQIKFEKNRFGLWKPLNPDTYSVKPTDPITTGGLFPFDDNIALTDKNGNKVGEIDSQSGELKLGGGCSSRVGCGGGRAFLEIRQEDEETGIQDKIFSIEYKPKKLADTNPIVVLHPQYSLRNLDITGESEFDGGSCFAGPAGVCEIYISKKGALYLPEPYRYEITGKYSFDNGVVTYEMMTQKGDSIGLVRFIPEAFE